MFWLCLGDWIAVHLFFWNQSGGIPRIFPMTKDQPNGLSPGKMGVGTKPTKAWIYIYIHSDPQIDGKVNHHQISRDWLFHLFGDDYPYIYIILYYYIYIIYIYVYYIIYIHPGVDRRWISLDFQRTQRCILVTVFESSICLLQDHWRTSTPGASPSHWILVRKLKPETPY